MTDIKELTDNQLEDVYGGNGSQVIDGVTYYTVTKGSRFAYQGDKTIRVDEDYINVDGSTPVDTNYINMNGAVTKAGPTFAISVLLTLPVRNNNGLTCR